MRFKVTYEDIFEADNKEEAHLHLLAYLEEMVENEEALPFKIEMIK